VSGSTSRESSSMTIISPGDGPLAARRGATTSILPARSPFRSCGPLSRSSHWSRIWSAPLW
jgi:hypothetical protein